MKKLIAAAFAAVFSFAVHAQEGPLQFDRNACMLDQGGTLTLQTLAMPKGWFSSRNLLDKNKTDLRTTYSMDSSVCVKDSGSGMFSSKTTGTFIAVQNPQSKDIAYIWNMIGDLSASQNHWHYHIACDGSKAADGCQESRTVTFAIKAYGQDGQCRTFVNSSGVTTCATDTISLELASVQDADVQVPQSECAPADVNCGIGACESDCEHSCDTQFPAIMQDRPNGNGKFDVNSDARQACKHACPCECKALRPPTCNSSGNDCQ